MTVNRYLDVAKNIGKPIISWLPLFVWSMFLQSPILISYLHNAPLKALLMFVNFGDGATSDLYFVLLLSMLIVYVGYLLSKWLHSVCMAYKVLAYVLLVATFVVRKFLLYEFGLQLSPSTFSLLQETNNHEVSGFIGDYILSSTGAKYLVMACLFAIVIGLSEWLYSRKQLKRKFFSFSKSIGIVVGVLIVMGIPAIRGGYKLLMAAPGGQSTFSAVHCTLMKISETSVESHGFWNKIKAVNSKENVACCTDDSLNVVFVLGESFIKSHSSLYGYPRKTMPNMGKEQENGNLFVFKDMVSPFNGTSNAMKNLFCLNDLSKGEKWYKHVFWPQLFKKAGFNLYLWDNQKNFDKRHGNTFYEMYSHLVADLCYDGMNGNAFDFDEQIVDDFKKNCRLNPGVKNFVWFHLMGQHFAFADKCPESKKVFKSKDIKRKNSYLTTDMKQVIADYDNAVHYNDYVLGKIIDMFRNSNSVIVFISDHGEEAYDYRAKASRPAMEPGKEKEYAHCQHDVPMLVWCSDKYMQIHPNIIYDMSKSLSHSSMTDKIGFSMLKLANIESPYYKSKSDIISSKFEKRHRSVYLMGGEKVLNYDYYCCPNI